MRFGILLLTLPALLASSLSGAEDLKWRFKSTNARIELVMADDSHVMVEAAPISPAQATRGGSGWNVTFEVPGETSERQLKGSPLFFILGPLTPNKPAHPFNLVKLEKKGGIRSWVMKVTDLDIYPSPGNEVVQIGRRPKPVQAADGNFTLSLPFAPPPGEYALFTDVEVWEFTVRPN